MSLFWNIWIIGLTVISLVWWLWLLLANRYGGSRTETETTTGHAHDGIEEYDNPLPAWWMWMFLLSIVFAVGYLIAYPGLGSFPGLLNWTQIKQWEGEVARAEQEYGELFASYRATPVEELLSDRRALKMGQRLFANNCAQCHGSDARGSYGFPNLADNDWLWGGSVEAIHTSIANGRVAVMPPWLAALGEQGIAEVADYVLSFSTDVAATAAGQQKYGMYCASCHGPEGKGNIAFGAPDLTNGIWLYSGSRGEIMQTIRNGRNGQMPAHRNLLGDDRIHLITAYVYSLSHGGASQE